MTLAQSAAPEGRQWWTLRLLADRLVELGVVEDIFAPAGERERGRGAFW